MLAFRAVLHGRVADDEQRRRPRRIAGRDGDAGEQGRGRSQDEARHCLLTPFSLDESCPLVQALWIDSPDTNGIHAVPFLPLNRTDLQVQQLGINKG